MVEARWNGAVIARSNDTVVVEGSHYFAPDDVDQAVLRPSGTTSVCRWKGVAHYHTLAIDGAENRDAACYYPQPKPAAAEIKDRITFRKGVEVR